MLFNIGDIIYGIKIRSKIYKLSLIIIWFCHIIKKLFIYGIPTPDTENT